MAERIEGFDIEIPAETLESNPLDTALDMREGIVERLEIVVPRGHAGLTGFAFLHSSQQVIPFVDGQFVITDNEVLIWPVEGYPTGDRWVFRAFNKDVFVHSFHIRILLSEFEAPTGVVSPIVPVG